MNPDGTPDGTTDLWSKFETFANFGLKTYDTIKNGGTTTPAANAAANTTVASNGPVQIDQKTMLIGGAVILAAVLFVTLRK